MMLARVRIPTGSVMAELLRLDYETRLAGDWYLVRFLADGFIGYVPGDNLLAVWEIGT